MRKILLFVIVFAVFGLGVRDYNAMAVYFETPDAGTRSEKIDIRRFASEAGKSFADGCIDALSQREEFIEADLDKIRGYIENFGAELATVCLKNNITSIAVDKILSGLRTGYVDVLANAEEADRATDSLLRGIERQFRLMYMNFSEVEKNISKIVRGHLSDIIPHLDVLKKT